MQIEPITNKLKMFSCNKRNTNVMRVGDTILFSTAEADIGENWCLIGNQSTYNTLINRKYLSHIINCPTALYSHVQLNTGVTYTNKIGGLPGYSNHVCYNPMGIFNILLLILVQKHYLVTYNNQ